MDEKEESSVKGDEAPPSIVPFDLTNMSFFDNLRAAIEYLAQ